MAAPHHGAEKARKGFVRTGREVLRTGGCGGGSSSNFLGGPSQLLRRSTLCGAASFFGGVAGASPISSAVIMLVTKASARDHRNQPRYLRV